MSAHGGPSRATRIIRVAAIPIILAWIAVTAALNLLVPQIEVVGQQNAVSSSPRRTPRR